MGMVVPAERPDGPSAQSCPRREAPLLSSESTQQTWESRCLCGCSSVSPPPHPPLPSPAITALVFVTIVFSTGWTFSAEALKFTSPEELYQAPPLAPLKSQKIKRAILLCT